MKVKHLIFLLLAALGVLYLWHLYSAHGGISSLKLGGGSAT